MTARTSSCLCHPSSTVTTPRSPSTPRTSLSRSPPPTAPRPRSSSTSSPPCLSSTARTPPLSNKSRSCILMEPSLSIPISNRRRTRSTLATSMASSASNSPPRTSPVCSPKCSSKLNPLPLTARSSTSTSLPLAVTFCMAVTLWRMWRSLMVTTTSTSLLQRPLATDLNNPSTASVISFASNSPALVTSRLSPSSSGHTKTTLSTRDVRMFPTRPSGSPTPTPVNLNWPGHPFCLVSSRPSSPTATFPSPSSSTRSLTSSSRATSLTSVPSTNATSAPSSVTRPLALRTSTACSTL
mmetsp:Transcript_47350/g.78864  ORF Transcript_47350/g.78864 Transcript_47350/m.78864 type:complete len:296 (-) Transcript_47350:275-1162(-)